MSSDGVVVRSWTCSAPRYRRAGDAICYPTGRTVVVVSAGNHGESLQQKGYSTIPNSLAGVMSISATGPNDKLTF